MASEDVTGSERADENISLRHNVDYRWWLFGDTLALLGTGIQIFCLPLYAVLATGSMSTGGMIATLSLASMALCALPGGVIVDRMDRRPLLIVQAIAGVLLGCVFMAVHVRDAPVGALVVVAVLMGSRNGFFWSVTNATLKSVVSANQIGPAMSANQGRDAVVNLLAAPTGGLLYGVNPGLPFAAYGILSLSTLASAFGIRADLKPVAAEGVGFLRGMSAGIGYVVREPYLRTATIVMVFANFAAGGLVITVVLTLQQLGVPGWRIGAVEATLGLGLILGAILTPVALSRFTGGRIVIVGGSWMTACFGALVFGPAEAVVFTAMFLGGVSLAPVNAVIGGYMMAIVPSARQGRVQSIAALGAMGLASAGPIVAGFGLDMWGYTTTIACFCCVALITLGCMLGSTSMRTVPAADQWARFAQA